MALQKTIISEKGVVSKYHMISGLKITDRIEVYLKSYTDESYREMEKAIDDNRLLIEELRQKQLEEMVKEEPDTEVLESIERQIMSLDIVSKDYSVGTITYKLPFSKEDDISYSNIYEKLKQEAIFEGSEDC